MLKNEINLSSILELMKNRKKNVIKLIVTINLIVLIYVFITPQTFTSTIRLMPPKESSGGGGLSSFIQNMAGSAINFGGGGKSSQSNIFAEILKSRLVMDSLNSKLELLQFKKLGTDKLISYYNVLTNSIEVVVDKNGFISYSVNVQTGFFANKEEQIKISKLSQQIAQSAVFSLDEILRSKNISTARKSKEYIINELNKYYLKSDSISKRLELFQEQNKVLAIDDQTQAIVTQAITLGTELNKIETDLNLALIQYDKNTPYVVTLQKQVDFVKNQLNKVQNGTFNESNDFAFPLKKVPQLTREYANLFREKKIIEQVIMYLETQRHQEAIQEEKDLPIVEILDNALIPESRTYPNRVVTLILGFVSSVLLGICFLIISAIYKGNLILNKLENND
ncbi:MAG: Wzz/FepE/Etk N-terminal domain-containing protein [Candidatus Kapabacteria bacterium]|nr:Wzz/FepE/Etk N-terminal domain-containing protein [Candidatus Kapabacteria bacterium]